MKIYILMALCAIGNSYARANDFLWGVASSAYQTEGGYLADGKGISNWDYFTAKEITKNYNGEIHTGNVAVDGYNKYEEDIELIKNLGANSYRFSVAWSRVLPDGVNKNQPGINYYKKIIKKLKENKIRPMITIYHWDMPLNIYLEGGAKNKKFVEYYREYANLLFDEFGQDADFVTFNEPINETYELVPMVSAMLKGDSVEYSKVFNDEETRAKQAESVDNIILANAVAINEFKKRKLDGKIGITIAFSPQIAFSNSDKDSAAAAINSEFRNEWILDVIYKKKYPENLFKEFAKYGWSGLTDGQIEYVANNKPDFIGVNYYSETLIKYNSEKAFGVEVVEQEEKEKSYNGASRPEGLSSVLHWLNVNYKNPSLIITEVGAGFGEADDARVGKSVDDNLRARFVREHAKAALKAKEDGVKLDGFYVWSLLDNFEWMCAYKCRFGLVYVDYNDGLKRYPKKSYYEYQDVINAYSK